jgi:hydrogenase maturation protease
VTVRAAPHHLEDAWPGREKTLVLGLGNPLRADDGVGAAVIESLRETLGHEDAVDLIDGGTPGLESVLLLQGRSRVIVVDAADMGLEPGAWRTFTLDEVVPVAKAAMQGTLHDAGLFEALALAEALDALPAELVIFGVQPGSLGWEQGLTPPVRRAVPALCEAIGEALAVT